MKSKFRTELIVTCMECGVVVVDDNDANDHQQQVVLPKQTLDEHATESAGHRGQVTFSAVFRSEVHVVLDSAGRRYKYEHPAQSAVGKTQLFFQRPDLPGEETE